MNSLTVTASKLLIAQGCQIGHFCEQINVTNRSFTEIVVILPKIMEICSKNPDSEGKNQFKWATDPIIWSPDSII